MKTLFYSLFTILSLLSSPVFCQPKCYFEHYGAEDGLPQHTIMHILQDQKGFMWFSTWDGLCKFDGYNFYTYKIQQGDSYHMRSNRIDHIYEDKYGYIWTLPYDFEAHRFDPRTEKFMGMKSLDGYKDYTFTTKKIVTARSGKVWLLSDNMGCVCVIDSTFRIATFNVENEKLVDNKVNAVYEDKENISWILTNSGLYSLSSDNKTMSGFFTENENFSQSFYSVMELNNEIWFGSDKGKVWIYNKKNKAFNPLETNSLSGIKYIADITENQIFLATENDGFFIYHVSSKKLNKYTMSNLANMRSNQISTCYIDNSKNIWIELNTLGVAKFNVSTQKMKHFDVKIESFSSSVFPPNFSYSKIKTIGSGFIREEEDFPCMIPLKMN